MNYQKVRLLGGAECTIDLDNEVSCKKCSRPMFWAVTKNGKKMPVEKDSKGKWLSHFATCPYASDFNFRGKGAKIGEGDRLTEIKRQQQRERRLF